MANYKQLKNSNWKIPYLGGWCEGHVSMAWGYSNFSYDKKGSVIGTYSNGKGKAGYKSAIAHWNAKKGNHTGRPPKGISVPVFFKLGNEPAGHVAFVLEDGRVASSTQAGYHPQSYIHPSIDDLIKVYAPYNGGCTYLGWSEYVAGVQVVKSVAKKSNAEIASEVSSGKWGNNPERAAKLKAAGYDPGIIQTLVNQLIAERDAKAKAEKSQPKVTEMTPPVVSEDPQPAPEPSKPVEPAPTPPEKPVETKPEPGPELPLEPDETATPVSPEVIPPSTEPYDGFEHVTKQGVVATVIAFIIFVLTLIGIRLGGN